jgi:hypothetical protein
MFSFIRLLYNVPIYVRFFVRGVPEPSFFCQFIIIDIVHTVPQSRYT